jgi:general secretion pathway protein I
MRRHGQAGGFTLIEVLVALAVVSMAMLAVIGSAGQSTRTVAALRDRTFAEWVAANRLTELRLAPDWPALGDSDGDSQLAGEQWHWKVHVKKTADPDLRRIEIDVAHKDTPDSTVESLVGFIAKQTPPAPPPGTQSTQTQGGNSTNSNNSGSKPGVQNQPVRRPGGGR